MQARLSMQLVEKLYSEMYLPDEVHWLNAVFTKAGAKLYVVGGAVRDFVVSLIRGESFNPKDFDLVTNLHPDSVVRLLLDAKKEEDPYNLSIKEVGKAFGIVLVNLNGNQYEIATFREDSKTGDGRRPDYVTFSTIEKDSERRDLTINALYYDMAQKAVLDYHGGIADLHAKRIRFVGDAMARIYEDKLRVMRFVRFHSKVNPNGPESVDKDTKAVILQCNLREQYSTISGERIREEFVKGVSSALDVKNYLAIMHDLGLLQQVFHGLQVTPELYDMSIRCLEGIVAQILRYNKENLVVHNVLLKNKWTRDEAEQVMFLVGMERWTPELFVEFRQALSRAKVYDGLVRDFARSFCDNWELIHTMMLCPYPTVSSSDVMAEGFQGRELGLEIKRREVKNFKAWCDGK